MALIKFADTSATPEPLTYVTNDISGYGVVGQADVPGLTADQQQRKVEEIQRKVILPLINKNIDDTCAISVYDTDADGRVNGADEADALTTARTIGLTDADGTNTGTSASFDGSADVTLKLPATIKANIAGAVTGNAATATKLETARNITIGSKANAFDGSAPVTYTLADIGAAAASHSHAESDITDLTTDLAAKLPLSGGTLTGALTLSGAPTANLEAATKKYVDDSISFAGGGDMMKTVYDTDGDGVVNAADTAAACTGNAATSSACTGNAATATTAAACSGNAATATKLAATKNITVGSKTNAFDGSANITFSLADVGAAAVPSSTSGTGSVTVTVSDNCEYSYTAVTSLAMTGAAVNCHGFVTFAGSTPTISVSNFTKSGGDDITTAAASEVWEFSVCAHNSGSYIVWKNWSV